MSAHLFILVSCKEKVSLIISLFRACTPRVSPFELIKEKQNETFLLKKKINEKRPVVEESKPARRSSDNRVAVSSEPSLKRQKRDENDLVKFIDPNAQEIIVAQTINSLGKRKMFFVK